MDEWEAWEGEGEIGEERKRQRSAALTAAVLRLAGRTLAPRGRVVLFVPVRGAAEAVRTPAELLAAGLGGGGGDTAASAALGALGLRLICARRQRFSPTFSRWIACLERAEDGDAWISTGLSS